MQAKTKLFDLPVTGLFGRPLAFREHLVRCPKTALDLLALNADAAIVDAV